VCITWFDHTFYIQAAVHSSSVTSLPRRATRQLQAIVAQLDTVAQSAVRTSQAIQHEATCLRSQLRDIHSELDMLRSEVDRLKLRADTAENTIATIGHVHTRKTSGK
jgi:uncharacterized coiled-coil DUF342 family protein